MKSLKYTLAISLLTLLYPVLPAFGCWSSWYLPKGYYMYRVVDHSEDQGTIFSVFNRNSESNCREWQRYASTDIPLVDIYQVVYKMSLEEFEAFHKDRWRYSGDNSFLRWLSSSDGNASDFLLFAKITEEVRSRHNSRWYYPSMKTGARMTLEDIVDRAICYRGILRDRYLLQAVRAMFSLRRYADCIALWDEEVSLLPKESVMRQLILPYIAGAEYHMKNFDRAKAYFCEAGDIDSMIACSGADEQISTVAIIEQIYKYDPNSRSFANLLQQFIREAELDCGFSVEHSINNTDKYEYRRLARLSMHIAQEGKTENPAMWYYTAAFIEDLCGNPARASELLAKAERAHGTAFIKESVEVMRIYLDAKRMTYNQAYEKRLLGQLQWLDRKIAENITSEVWECTVRNNYMYCNISYYYWNDMLRRILLAEVCPRMIAAGKPIRALQLANMADNRLLGLVDCCIPNSRCFANGSDVCAETTNTMYEFRRDKDVWSPDYSNSFFEMIDSLGVDRAIEYRHRILYPISTFDRFLNERGYVAMDYINDIVGTQCLRTLRYGDAVIYLEQISRSFEGHLNTTLEYDPFSYERRTLEASADFKYRFAREMSMLEQEQKAATDADRKAETMFRYALGMRNSFGRCWPLTQYYLGTSYYGQQQEKRDWMNEPAARRARRRSTELLRTSCTLFNDRELAAKALYQLNQYRTVVEQYPDTKTGQYVRGHCDKLYDYFTWNTCL